MYIDYNLVVLVVIVYWKKIKKLYLSIVEGNYINIVGKELCINLGKFFDFFIDFGLVKRMDFIGMFFGYNFFILR